MKYKIRTCGPEGKYEFLELTLDNGEIVTLWFENAEGIGWNKIGAYEIEYAKQLLEIAPEKLLNYRFDHVEIDGESKRIKCVTIHYPYSDEEVTDE